MRLTIFITLVLVAALTVAVFTFRAVRRTPASVATLPNGMKVEFLGTAAGGTSFSTEKSWEGTARKILPRAWQGWIPPASSGSCSSGTNSFTVYLRVTDPSGAPINAVPWSNYLTEDEAGFKYPKDGGYCSFGGTPGQKLYGVILGAFPRRERNFLLHLTGPQGATLAALRIPNPLSGPFPEWRPELLPVTRTNGPVRLTLKTLTESGSKDWRHVSAKWHLASDDQRWTNARAGYVAFQDASGNQGSVLSPREKAWRLSTRVHRERSQDFLPTERMVLTNLAVPESGEFVDVGQRASVSGTTVFVRGIGGAGSLYVTNGVNWVMLPAQTGQSGHGSTSDSKTSVEYWHVPTPFIFVEVSGAGADDDVRFRLTEANGREIKLEAQGYNTSNNRRVYVERIRPGDGARSMNLEIIISRPLVFEFMIDPKKIQSTKGATN
ncbi:MAG: hypothetical protein H7X97_07990 [Opitutaceae bacterium]|nr:hypothetical protein [Verrucomicrobiales bacterium]